MSSRRLLGAGVVVAVVAVLAWAAFVVLGEDASMAESKLIGKPVPGLGLQQVDGTDAVSLAAPGAVTVINFWAPWCVPCLAEHRMLNQVVGSYSAEDVRFVSVVYQSDDGDVSAFLDRVGRNVPTLRDPDGLASIDFGVTGVPETFLVDRNGIVRHRVAGALSEAKLNELLRGLLDPPTA